MSVFQAFQLYDNIYHNRFSVCMENSEGPNQLASKKPADLDSHCFQKKSISRLRRTGVEIGKLKDINKYM